MPRYYQLDIIKKKDIITQTEYFVQFIAQCIEIDDEPPEALSMAWPETAKKRLTYILVAPILVPLWLTLPDTRTPRGKKFFPITFLGSICWIAAYSYLMVWWANMIGETADISPEVRRIAQLFGKYIKFVYFIKFKI